MRNIFEVAADNMVRARHAQIEEVCEASLVDPEGRGVLIQRGLAWRDFAVTLSADVPWGTIHERIGTYAEREPMHLYGAAGYLACGRETGGAISRQDGYTGPLRNSTTVEERVTCPECREFITQLEEDRRAGL